MIVFRYDKTFEGLLTAVFDAYVRRTFPDRLLREEEPAPLFCDEVFTVCTDSQKSGRVWRGLVRKVSKPALGCLAAAWQSELPAVDELLFRYIRKALDAPVSIEMNFGDSDVLEVMKIGKTVSRERHRVVQFARFQKTADGTYFAALEPLYNVLPLTLNYFRDRFADQAWLVYDIRRAYGYYYDLAEVTEVDFAEKPSHLRSGFLSDELLAHDEKLFQQLWKEYFRSTTIRERLNPKLHRQNMPARFWKYLTEKRV